MKPPPPSPFDLDFFFQTPLPACLLPSAVNLFSLLSVLLYVPKYVVPCMPNHPARK